MLRFKTIPLTLFLALIFLFGTVDTHAESSLSSGALTVDQTFKKEGLRIQLTVVELDDSDEGNTLFKVTSQVTNLTKKPIPYVQYVCGAVDTRIYLKTSNKSYNLSHPEGLSCPPMVEELVLPAGKSIQRSELLSTVFLSPDLKQERFEMTANMIIGNEENEKRLLLKTNFDKGITPASIDLILEAELSKSSKGFPFTVTGTAKDKEIKSISIKADKSKYSIKIDKKTRQLSFNKKLPVKGDPPKSAHIEIRYMDGTKKTFIVPIQLDLGRE